MRYSLGMGDRDRTRFALSRVVGQLVLVVVLVALAGVVLALGLGNAWFAISALLRG